MLESIAESNVNIASAVTVSVLALAIVYLYFGSSSLKPPASCPFEWPEQCRPDWQGDVLSSPSLVVSISDLEFQQLPSHQYILSSLFDT